MKIKPIPAIGNKTVRSNNIHTWPFASRSRNWSKASGSLKTDTLLYKLCYFMIEMFIMNIRASAGRSSIRHWRKDLTNDEKKCNSFRQFDESIKSTYLK